ncbi:MAG: hypothetical protein DBX38_01535 [Eubacteriales Family XIII. Incertae Sedis bacterium]|nr:MAG: hypothetical protein DBX38_01535 [Clostridiales Family XIII bacterium]
MKQFIVLMAVLPIMLIFLMQFTADQVNGEKVAFIQSVVYAAKEEAKQEGCFTEELKTRIVKEISEGISIPAECIEVASDDEVKYRYAKGEGRLIHYRVSVRLDGVMAGGRFLGISDSENTVTYVIDSSTASEKI